MAKFKQKEIIVTRRVVRITVEAPLYNERVKQGAIINALTKIRDHVVEVIPSCSFKMFEDSKDLAHCMVIDMVFDDWEQAAIDDHINEVIKFIERYTVVRIKEQG